MASAIIGGLISAGYDPKRLCAVDPNEAALAKLQALGVGELGTQPGPGFQHCELVVLAVKPQFMTAAAEGVKHHLGATAAVMSVAAGISVGALKTQLGNSGLPVVRCMPNTPALVGAGASGLFASAEVSADQRAGIEGVMSVVGTTIWLQEESHIDVVTAVSGSGPAYFFAFMEAMIATGKGGWSRLPDMPVGRYGLNKGYGFIIDDELYAIGGYVAAEKAPTASVDILALSGQRWPVE